MQEQCDTCCRHGAPWEQGSMFESPRNPKGYGHETGSYSWSSCDTDNDVIDVFMGCAPSELNIC